MDVSVKELESIVISEALVAHPGRRLSFTFYPKTNQWYYAVSSLGGITKFYSDLEEAVSDFNSRQKRKVYK